MPKAPYRYIGLAAGGFADTPYNFTRFGQEFEIDQDFIEQRIREDHFPALPESEFAVHGVTEKELKDVLPLVSVGRVTGDTEKLMAKIEAAWKAHEVYRDKETTPELASAVPFTMPTQTEQGAQ